ncbi:uncharacterized protein RHOBADRAFT_23682 [Rhodotorula graminis WP1]|uniref:GOLD domain-containing protein n=1 Tax=Rhodotorula graminis (strain WP1) TaxID=578459 RepID=A0A194SG47_RHOGW|nr:uncharacterized protein RHOBADRAFT_23682 [Rhodotorula graminis WP1]KPV78621.1 hypothetical protein RHOBADRAFT_23682 [Rhodotorula graminis WP1]
MPSSPSRLRALLACSAPLLVVVALLAAAPRAAASALTTTINANERSCFYAAVDKVGEKVGFYFAVCRPPPSLPSARPPRPGHPPDASHATQVQSGGSFDIDWTVTDPNDNIIIDGERERQGDYIFTAHAAGEYTFCFSNDMSSLSEKLVDFDIMVESEPRPIAPAKPTGLTEQTSSLEESIYRLSGSFSSIQRTQRYFRTRENRNVSTVRSTEWRIFTFSLLESCLMVGMSAFQVSVVQRFFSGPSRRRVV